MAVRRLILVLVALVSGGGAALLFMEQQQQETAVPQYKEVAAAALPVATTEILVAARGISTGERVEAGMLTWQAWPASGIRPDYLTRVARPGALEELIGTLVRSEIFAGEPVLSSKLAQVTDGSLSAVLDKGRRAVAVAVTPTDASGGYIQPNDRVDVVLSETEGAGLRSHTLLTNVKVLAVDSSLGPEAGAPKMVHPTGGFSDRSIATLDLSPDEAVAVINASRQGQLSLVLRALADSSTAMASAGGGAEPATGVRIIRFGLDAATADAGPVAARPAPTASGEAAP